MSSTSRWMARIGGGLSFVATATLILAQWRTWSGVMETVGGVLLSMGTGVAMVMLWTLVQAMVHTRLGSRPLFPEQSGAAEAPPGPRAVWWMTVVIALLLLWYRVDGWWSVEMLYARYGLLWTAVYEMESLLKLHLWPRLVVGGGLGFVIALLEHGVRSRDRVSSQALELLSDDHDRMPAAHRARVAQRVG